MQTKRLSNTLTGLTGLVLLLAIIILANMLVQPLRWRADLTEENLYTLSDGTRTLLSELQRPVTLKFYFSRSNEDLPIPLKQYGRRIRDLLSEYRAAGRGNIVMEVYDPRPDSDEEEWAQRYGLAGQSLTGMGPPLYAGIVAEAGGREAVIPFLSPGLEPQLEYLITRLIAQVTQAEKPVIGIMSPLPVMGLQMPPQMQMNPMQPPQQRPPWMFVRELQRQYDVEEVPMTASSIPDPIDTLLVIHPKDIKPAQLYALDQFVLRGGRLMVFVDPQCSAEAETMPQQNPYGFLMAASDINRLSGHWGLQMQSGNVVADRKLATRINMGNGVELLPTWLTLTDENIDDDSIATSMLEMVMLPYAGGFTGNPVEGLNITRLMSSTSEAMFLNSFQASSPGSAKMKEAKPAGQVTLALRLQGQFKTAFPDGPPVPAEGEANAPEGETLQEGEGVVVLVSDADLLYDRYCFNQYQIFGQTITEPINDNFNFIMNMVEQMTGNKALIGLRSRGSYDRPFDRVRELEAQAQARWQAEEIKLMDQLEDMQQRINELQQAKAEDQKFILSPEQKEEIEKFREKRFETQQELKEVRKNLRRDIERLGLQIKALNIAAMPLAVALFGLVYAWRRKRREQS